MGAWDWHKKAVGWHPEGKMLIKQEEKLRKKLGMGDKKMAKKSTTKKKKEKDDEDHAPQINLLQMGRDALRLQKEAYPQQLELERKYGADFARTETATATARANAEAAAVAADGGRMRSGILAQSPEIAAANKAMTDRLEELGPSELETELRRQAAGELKLEGKMSGDEVRTALQQARASFSARGIANGSPAAVAEVMNRAQYADARKASRRSFAGAVESQRQQRAGADAAVANNSFNTLGAFWDPQQRMFGKGGSAVSGQVSGPSQFAPYLDTSANIAKSNLLSQTSYNSEQATTARQLAQQAFDDEMFQKNAQEGRYLSGQQTKAANKSGMYSAIGSAAGLAALAFLI